MSATVITGKVRPQGRPVSGSISRGPLVPMQPPSTLLQMMKKRLVSSGSPSPTMLCHQPGLPVIGWASATNWSPVSAWQTRMALERSSLSRP